jgi:cobalt/nickel transport system permease protein
MHVPDGFLSPPIAATTWAVGGGALAVALGTERRDLVRVPAGVLGALASFVFAAQMVNLPVTPGTSGHLVGATLAAVMVGPWRALLVLAAVLAVQALLFQDGGLTSFGLNLVSMGLVGAFAGFAVAALGARLVRGVRGRVAGAMVGAFVATGTATIVTSCALAASGLYPLGGILPLMTAAHLPIGVLEAVLTGGVLVTVMRWRPDLVAGLDARDGRGQIGALVVGVLGMALAVAVLVAPFASHRPDGLERTALDLGFARAARPLLPPVLERALHLPGRFAGLVPALAGVIGTLLVGGLAWAVTRGLPDHDDAAHD